VLVECCDHGGVGRDVCVDVGTRVEVERASGWDKVSIRLEAWGFEVDVAVRLESGCIPVGLGYMPLL
jgi:hypothetical protein